MKIHGFVECDAGFLPDGKASFDVQAGGKSYSIISEGVQAAKDVIFVRKGQIVCIEGDRENQTLHAKVSKIDVMNEIKSIPIENEK